MTKKKKRYNHRNKTGNSVWFKKKNHEALKHNSEDCVLTYFLENVLENEACSLEIKENVYTVCFK